MSCFVMEPESMAALSEFTADLLNYGFNHYGFEAPDELAKALPDCRDPYCFFIPQKIYERLYALNVAAYTGRYGRDIDGAGNKLDGGQAPGINTSDYMIHGGFSGQHDLASWHFRLAKLLHCYNYQITEDATINHPLTVALRKLEHSLNSYIVTKSPEYEKAPGWGHFAYNYGEKQVAEPEEGEELEP